VELFHLIIELSSFTHSDIWHVPMHGLHVIPENNALDISNAYYVST